MKRFGVLLLVAACSESAGPPPPPPPPRPVMIAISPDSISLHIGQILQMHLVAIDSSGDTLSVDSVVWTSSDTAVLTVSGAGAVTARHYGVANISAYVDSLTDSARLRVLIPVARFDVSPLRVLLVPGGSIKLTTLLTGTDGSTLSDRDVTWNHAALVAITPAGMMKALQTGSDSITAVSEGIGSRDPVRVTVDRPTFVKVVSNGLADYACALTAGAATYCWGANEAAELGTGTYGDSLGRGAFLQSPLGGLWAPTGIPFLNPDVLAIGEGMTCAVLSGSLSCWGYNDEGAFATDAFQTIASPYHIALPVVATSAVAGEEWACALGTDSIPYCWGGSVTGFLRPPTASSTRPYASIFSGYKTLCGIAADSLAYCGYPRPSDQPLVSPTLKFTKLTVGRDHICGLSADSTAYCWGENAYGQLGDSTQTSHVSPGPVAGGHKFVDIAAGFDFTCGVVAGSGAAYCWGWAPHLPQPPVGTTITRFPEAVPGGLSFSQLTTGTRFACGLAAGKVYCWGDNNIGQLGDGTTTSRLTPTLVVGQQP